MYINCNISPREVAETEEQEYLQLAEIERSAKEQILARVTANGMELQHVPPEFKRNRDVVLAAVEKNGMALQFASNELRADRDVALAAVRNRGQALDYVEYGLSQIVAHRQMLTPQGIIEVPLLGYIVDDNAIILESIET